MPTKTKPHHSCSDCGYSSPKWFGKCPDCGSWSTAVDASPAGATGLSFSTLDGVTVMAERMSTGLDEVDRVLGGGLVAGSVVLLAGEPGIGKSTLVLQLLSGTAGDSPGMLVTGEESLQQVTLRARRLGVSTDRFVAAAGTDLGAIVQACEARSPGLRVVDSVQTLVDPTLEGSAGSPTQVRGSAARLVQLAKNTSTTVVLVGHVTKDGNVAGPKALEHVVDVVLALEGDRYGALRLLRASKNRFGSCDETGVFAMTSAGLEAVADPSEMLLADRCPGVPGSLVFPGLEGSRPVLMELQALVTRSEIKNPRRVAGGLDARRLALMLGVLAERVGLGMTEQDVFVTASGGLKVREPAADLPLALALYSARSGAVIPEGVVAFGEIGLGGEVRRVSGAERRISEAQRHGFDTALVPRGTDRARSSMSIVEIAHLRDALEALRALNNDGVTVRGAEKDAVVSLGTNLVR